MKPSYLCGGFLAFFTKIWYENRRKQVTVNAWNSYENRKKVVGGETWKS